MRYILHEQGVSASAHQRCSLAGTHGMQVPHRQPRSTRVSAVAAP